MKTDMFNSYSPSNQDNGIFIKSSKLSSLEAILLQLNKDLPEHIQPHELVSTIQDLLNFKCEEEMYKRLNLSTLKNKFKDDNDWELFKKLLVYIVLQNIDLNK